MEFLYIIVALVFVNNFVLAQFLGLCPFIGVSKKTDAAVSMGMAVIFVMALASVFTFTVYAFFIRAGEANLLGAAIGAFGFGDAAAYIRGNGLSEVLTTGVFILIIAALVQFIEMVIKKMSRPLYDALGIYLPLITTNCTVLGVSLLNINKIQPGGEWATLSFAPGLLWAGLSGLFAGVGFTLVMLLMSGIRERLEVTSLPRSFKGVPIAFVCTGMMALAFFGFAGMIGGLLDNFGR
jgi:electron transport complex protein RnfA